MVYISDSSRPFLCLLSLWASAAPFKPCRCYGVSAVELGSVAFRAPWRMDLQHLTASWFSPWNQDNSTVFSPTFCIGKQVVGPHILSQSQDTLTTSLSLLRQRGRPKSQHWDFDCPQNFKVSGQVGLDDPVLAIPCGCCHQSTHSHFQSKRPAPLLSSLSSPLLHRTDTGVAGWSSSCCLPWGHRMSPRGPAQAWMKISE